MGLKKILVYGFIVAIVLFGLSMFHGGIRNKVLGNISYFKAIRSLDLYELECSENNLASFDGQIAELLKIPRMDAYTGAKHKLEGELIFGSSVVDVNFSPVGMYADHWREKPSIRVSLVGQSLKNGMSEFGFLRPVTRNFLGDWIAGIISEDAGLINLKREIVALSLNGESRKAFLLEETFRGYSNRKKEYGFAMKYVIQNDTCVIKAYNDTVPKRLISDINSRITQVLSDPSQADSLFDLNQMAKFYVVNDITQGFHQLVEFNTHFFYNYKTGLLEPIGREWNSSTSRQKEQISTRDYLKLENPQLLPSLLHVRLFENETLLKAYENELSNVQEEHILSLIDAVEEKKELYVEALWKDLGSLEYDFEYIQENLKFIQAK